MISRFRTEVVVFLRRIGTCARCMRDSLLFAMASLGIFAVSLLVFAVTGIFAAVAAAGVLAAAAVALFVLHIVVAGIRGGRFAVREKGESAPEGNEPVDPLLTRRAVFARFLRYAGLASMSAIAVAAAPGTANAAYCMYIGTECPYGYPVCCADRRFNPATPYCCPPGYGCNGQGGCV